MRFGLIAPLQSTREVVGLAQIAEQAGFWGFGVPDTAPRLYQGCYPTVTAALLATTRIRVGPQVTNPISQHWSVHAAAARAIEELAPGRLVLGIATGDGAVLSVGLRQSSWAELERSVTALREMGPVGLDVHVATSGRIGAAAAGRVATDVEFGVGLDLPALRRLTDHAREAHRDAGRTDPLRVWVMVPTYVVPDEEQLAAARRGLRVIASATARFCFAKGFRDKNVPPEWQPLIRERLQRYDHGHHAIVGRDAPNSLLFDDLPTIENYLIDRMLAVGTADQVRDKLLTVARDAQLDGIWLSMSTSPFGESRTRTLERLAVALRPGQHRD